MSRRAAALRRLSRLLVLALIGGCVLAATSAIGHWPVGAPADRAALRLALRADRSSVVVCRAPTAEESASLPRHMRAAEVCDERPVTYRLRVTIDGVERLDRRIQAAGLRGDRPLVVQEQFEVVPGRRRLLVAFVPEDDAGTAPSPAPGPGSGAAVAVTEAVRQAHDRLSRAHLDAEAEFVAGRVRLLAMATEGQGQDLAGWRAAEGSSGFAWRDVGGGDGR